MGVTSSAKNVHKTKIRVRTAQLGRASASALSHTFALAALETACS